ncbi:MAG TPA: FlgD immunoglobulin-like domain containing protein [Thermoanaerobaculia bacterium]|nr:FlgD immunoglobulin-like domain containing protein [Thermoanaerobaculia bacterium]
MPNPCRRQTTIRYSVPGRGNGALPVRIEIFDVQGRRVALLADAPQVPGEHTVQWNGRDAAGHRISAGVYYCCLRAAGTSAIKTLVVLK